MNRTETAIIEAFWQILEEKPYNKITVKDIVEKCQVNRNTFYYHFHDIPELLERVIKQDADQLIQNYKHFGTPIDCLETLIQSVLTRKKSILHIYKSLERGIFLEQLDKTTVYCAEKFIDTVTADIPLTAEDKKLLTKFYKCAFVGIILDWLDEDMSYDLTESLKRISNLFTGSAKQSYVKSLLGL